ncbi:hypothetical protein AHF37_01326 [Paragonimus kellicotti]|nr:hypothetical protein AHF37_01326 [Paragonimus kellicotti]
MRFFGVKPTTSGGSFNAMHTKSDKGRSNHHHEVFRVRQPTKSVDSYCRFATGSPKNDSRSSHSDSQSARKKQSAGVNYCYYQVKARSDAINDLRMPLRPEPQVLSIKNPECSTYESDYFENLILKITTSGIIGEELPEDLVEAPLTKEAYMENAQKPETQSLVRVCLREDDSILVDKFIVNSVHVQQISAYESVVHRIKRRACEVNLHVLLENDPYSLVVNLPSILYLKETQSQKNRTSGEFEPVNKPACPNAARALPAELRSSAGKALSVSDHAVIAAGLSLFEV